MKKIAHSIHSRDYVVCLDDINDRIYLVKDLDVDGKQAEVLFLALSEFGDDVLIYSTKIDVNRLVPAEESFINLNGHLAYVKSLIESGDDIMLYNVNYAAS